jgi:hypothetical protein
MMDQQNSETHQAGTDSGILTVVCPTSKKKEGRNVRKAGTGLIRNKNEKEKTHSQTLEKRKEPTGTLGSKTRSFSFRKDETH